MLTKDIEITAPHGLHLRVAAQVVREANKGKSRITFNTNGRRSDGRSILGLLSLAAPQNSTVTLTVEGEDEAMALRRVELILVDGAGI